MDHIKRVLEFAESFDRDIKGGTGYLGECSVSAVTL